MDVFISWTGADKEIKNVIAERLAAEGLTCWDSERECTSSYSHECVEGIRESKVFLVIISNDSMRKGYVLNEVIAARNLENEGLLNILVYKVTDAPYTDDFEFQLNHVSFVSGNLVQRKEAAVGESSIDVIAKRARKLVDKRNEGNPEKPFDVKRPEIDGLIISRPGYFVENSRDAVLAEMDEAFGKSNVIVLKEICGFGKKSAVKKYADIHKADYDTAVIVENGNGNLRHFFVNVLEFTNINSAAYDDTDTEKVIRKKISFLNKLDERTLLIVSGVNFGGQHDELVCQLLSSLRCRIILVTEGSTERYDDWFPVIAVGKMDEEYLYELFFHYYNCADEEERAVIEPYLKEFFEKIGGHTRTIELTGSVLSREMYIYPEDVPKYLGLQSEATAELKETIVKQISNLFNMDRLTDDEKTALLVAAYIAVPAISEKRYREVLEKCGVRDWKAVAELDKRRWIDVDMKNRKISIEPLISTIVLTEFEKDCRIASVCVEYVTDLISKTSAYKYTFSKLLTRGENILENTGLVYHAAVLRNVNRYLADPDNFDTEELKKAVNEYENRYLNSADDDEYYADDYDDEPSLTDEEAFFEKAGYLVDIAMPLARIYCNRFSSLALDFSAESERLYKLGGGNVSPFNLEEIADISKEELMEILEYHRQQRELDEDFDEDDILSSLWAELLVVMDGIYSNDHTAVFIGINQVIELIENNDDMFFEEKDIAEYICAIFTIITTVYIKSGLYFGAVKLCRKIVSYKFESVYLSNLLLNYVTALKRTNDYGDELFDAYEELIRCQKKALKELTDDRAESDSILKETILGYAEALLKSGYEEEALCQFDAAQKFGLLVLPDETLQVAEEIVDAFAVSGEFDEAVEFIKSNFEESYLTALEQRTEDYYKGIIEKFRMYTELDCCDESDFQSGDENQYVSYYQNFSRKNNSMSEHKYIKVAEKAQSFDFSGLTDSGIGEHAEELKRKAKREKLLSLAPEAFALASEAGMRVLGFRHHYVQYMGAAAMADGKIAEIMNGEGKTYTIVLTAFLNYLYGKKVYVVDSSEFLTERNFNWMRGVYRLLGMTAELMENQLQIYRREGRPQSDVTYTSLKPLIFGFLNGDINPKFDRRSIRLDCAIIDEIDSVLVDGANSPYVLSRTSKEKNEDSIYSAACYLAKKVGKNEDYFTYTKGRVVLNPGMHPLIEKTFSVNYSDIRHIEKIKLIERLLAKAILVYNYYEAGRDYYLYKGAPVYENKEKGRFESFDNDTEYFLLRKNGLSTHNVEMAMRQKTINTITIRDMFRKFGTICGTTATAISFKKEFEEIYGLDYVMIPPFAPCLRKDYLPPMFMDMRSKDMAVVDFVREKSGTGQPILVVTQSIEESEKYERLLKNSGVSCVLLNAYNEEKSADMLAFAGKVGSVLVSTALVNRGVDIRLGGNPEVMAKRELVSAGVDISGLENLLYNVSESEREESELYKRYSGVLEKNKALCAAEKKRVLELGGLCVIGTSFFTEPRTEQQTRGRSGRQGEAGESHVFISIEDPSLIDLFEKSMVFFNKMKEGADVSVVSSKMLSKQCEKFQQKMHDAKFAAIRSVNKESKYIDEGRKYFTEPDAETTSIPDIITAWAKSEPIKKRLTDLIKNKAVPETRGVGRIYAGHKKEFESFTGSRHPEKVLARIVISQYNRLLEGNDEAAKILFCDLKKRYASVFISYIDFVHSVVYKAEVKDRDMDKIITAERERLLNETTEIFALSLFSVKGFK